MGRRIACSSEPITPFSPSRPRAGRPALASACGGPSAAWTAALRREAGRAQAIRLRHSERRHEFHSEIHHGPSASPERCRCCTHSGLARGASCLVGRRGIDEIPSSPGRRARGFSEHDLTCDRLSGLLQTALSGMSGSGAGSAPARAAETAGRQTGLIRARRAASEAEKRRWAGLPAPSVPRRSRRQGLVRADPHSRARGARPGRLRCGVPERGGHSRPNPPRGTSS